MATQIKLRRDSAANWALEDPVLAEGEPGYDVTNNVLKIGDGSTIWSLLPSIYDPGTDIVPAADNTYDLGSPSKQWRHVYTAGGSIYLDNIKLTNVGGKFVATTVINPGQENETPDPEDSDAASEIGGGGNANTGDITFNGTTISTEQGNSITIQTTTNSDDDNRILLGDNFVEIYAYNDNDNSWAEVLLNNQDGNAPYANMWVKSDSGAEKVWRFDHSGDLTLPAGGTISYTPDDTDNWDDPAVNTIQAALDELAAKVTALQNFEIDGGNAYTPPQGELLIDGNGA